VNAKHHDLALRALKCGRGLQWAADATTLPLRLVVKVAAQNGMLAVGHDTTMRASLHTACDLAGPSVTIGRIHARKAVAA
jgi:hypothetical protein